MAGADCRVSEPHAAPGACHHGSTACLPPSFIYHTVLDTQTDQKPSIKVIPALSCGINDLNAGIKILERIRFITLMGQFVLLYWGKPFLSVSRDPFSWGVI